jgi:hypothetical protein
LGLVGHKQLYWGQLVHLTRLFTLLCYPLVCWAIRALLLKAKAAGAASTNVKGYGIVDLGTTSELGYARSVSTATPFIAADIRAVLSSNSSIMSGLKSNVTSYGYSGSLNSYTVDFTVSRTINIVSLVQSASESLIMYGYDLYAERII